MNDLVITKRSGFVLGYLLDTKQPEWMYILKALATVVPVSLVMGVILDYLFPNIEPPFELDAKFLIYAMISAPIYETFIMIPILAIIKKFTDHTVKIALVSAVIWGVIHGVSYLPQGFGVLFSFFVFSLVFLSWDAVERVKAIYITMVLHALMNTAIFLVAFFAGF